MLQRLEDERLAEVPGKGSDDVLAAVRGLAGRLEHRGQLDRLVGGLPAGSAVADRAHMVLSGAGTERTDDELLVLAQQQIDAMVQRARDQLAPATPDHTAPFERLATLSIVVADHREVDGDRYCVDYGLGWVTNGAVLSHRDFDQIAECEMSWPIHNETLGAQWNYVAAAFDRLAEDNSYLVRWILSPATSGALPTESMFEIWQAGAELWVTGDRVVVARGAAQPAGGRQYSPSASAEPQRSPAVDAWLITAGPNGARAIELAHQARDGFVNGTKRHLYLYLESLSLPSVPPVHLLGDWTHLTIRDNPGIDLNIVEFSSLTDVAFGGCELDQVPQVVRQLRELTGLVLGDNPLSTLPSWLGELTALERLGLGRTLLADLPSSIGDMAGLRTLMINNCEMQQVPPPLATLTALQELRLDSNAISELPAWISEMSGLQVLNLERNGIAELPASIGQLSSLRELKLAHNQIVETPGSIAQLQNLELLELTGNPLRGLARELLELPAKCVVRLRGGSVPKELARARTIADLREAWAKQE